ncbi:hypothetical protein MMC11_003725 [Xylographa trunciseda]|nr:hypothetical protein [Xylographa trunciseda]
MPTLLRNLPFASLPQNFSDAALITARLGCSYLWIDSLCIIQDSDDWDREAATMGDVYSNAVFTIAALSATNSHGGCFVTRNPLAFEPCLLRDGDGRDTVWAESQRVQRPDLEGDMRPPLHRRAWVVQEQALAPRTLYFGYEMVFWECVEGTASGENPELLRVASAVSDDRIRPFGFGIANGAEDDTAYDKATMSCWRLGGLGVFLVETGQGVYREQADVR